MIDSKTTSTATRDASSYLAKFPISELRMGAMLYSPVFDAESQPPKLLLAAGTTLTESLVAQLLKRGIQEVRVAPQELMNLTRIEGLESSSFLSKENSARHFEAEAQPKPPKSQNVFETRKPGTRWGATDESFIHHVSRFGVESYDPILASHYKREFSGNLRKSEELFHNIIQGQINNSRSSVELLSSGFEHIRGDIDLFLHTNLTSLKYTGPWKHSYQTSMLALGLGTVLGLNRQELQELSLGCFLHEVGAMRLNKNLIYSAKPISQLDHLELSKHPGYTMDILTRWSDIPGSSCLIAYQMHERCNGTGYPHGRLSTQIHYLSKVAAVADTYINLMSQKPDGNSSPVTLPYQALEQILYQVRAGNFDRDVVRALIYTISLFPIGSLVELSDYRIGRVLRSNRENYLAPICEVWWRDDPMATKEIIDLSEQEDLFVVRALTDSPAPKLPPEGPLERESVFRDLALPDNDELLALHGTQHRRTNSFLDDEISSILDELEL